MKITKAQRSAIAQALLGKRQYIRKGRSANSAGFGNATPIEVIPGNSGPELLGSPYLKTTFRNGPRFSRTLYTPSTLHVRVGSEWLATR